MCTEILGSEFFPGPCRNKARSGSAVYLSMPPDISKFRQLRGNLESFLKEFLDHVVSISHPYHVVRVSVREKKKMADMEEFYAIAPSRWFQLNVECQSESDLEAGALKALKILGCRSPEWAIVEGSESRLGAFYLATQESPDLILHIQNRGARRSCDFLIPVFESQ